MPKGPNGQKRYGPGKVPVWARRRHRVGGIHRNSNTLERLAGIAVTLIMHTIFRVPEGRL